MAPLLLPPRPAGLEAGDEPEALIREAHARQRRRIAGHTDPRLRRPRGSILISVSDWVQARPTTAATIREANRALAGVRVCA